MIFHLFQPVSQLADVHIGQLGNVLIPYLIRQSLAVEALAVALRTGHFGQKLVGPLLPGRRIIVVHHSAQILHHAVEGHEIVARRVDEFFVYTHVLHRSVEYLAHGVGINVLHGRLDVEAVLMQNGIYLPENHLLLKLAQRQDGPFVDAQLVVGNNLLQVYLVDVAQSFAVRTGAFRRIEREDIGRRVFIGQARHGVHEALGEVFSLAGVLVGHHDEAVALLHGCGHTLAQALAVALFHLKLVYHHLYVMVLVSVYLHAPFQAFQLAVYPNIQIAFAPHALKELAIVALAVAHQGRQQVYAAAVIVVCYHVYHLLFGIFHHLLAAHVAVGRAGTGKEQAQIVVYLGGGAHGGTRVLVGGLLLNGDDGRQSGNLIHVGPLHIAKEVAGIGREGLDVTALPFSKDCVESQRRLARP